MDKILIWGAGKIARAFLAPLFSQAGYSLLFVDQDKTLVQQLQAAGSYPVMMVTTEGKEQTILMSGFQVLHTGEVETLAEGSDGRAVRAARLRDPPL